MIQKENKKGLTVRYTIHKILYAIKYQNKSFEKIFEEEKLENKFETSDYKLIYDVSLTSMRKFLYINKIIEMYSKRKPKKHQYILLLSSITQLVYLNYKNYAVINCTVEIAKKKNINGIPGYINGILKTIDKNKINLRKIKIDEKIIKQHINKNIIKNLSKENTLNIFNSVAEKPQIHLVFKNKINIKNESINITKSTNLSGIINDNQPLKEISEFKKGNCWVQDLSSMLPIYLTNDLNNLKALDMCAAPGGKTFQLIQGGAKVFSVEKNKVRSEKLELNLDRLKLKSTILNVDALDLNEDEQFDIIIIDAPCSSIGTIRRNPDILFKNNGINLEKKTILQKKLLKKADKMLVKNGLLIYIVCSFIGLETNLQINNFLNKNNNYSVVKFESEDQFINLIDSSGFINIKPQKLNNILIDGFFAAKLRKNV